MVPLTVNPLSDLNDYIKYTSHLSNMYSERDADEDRVAGVGRLGAGPGGADAFQHPEELEDLVPDGPPDGLDHLGG